MTNDKPVLVIGGCGPGLGRGLATVFEKAGYEIVTLSRSGSVHPGAFNIACDLRDENEVNQNFMEIMHRFGKIDVYIHNVFALHVGGFLDTSTKQFEQLWADTVKSAFHVTQQIIPQMLQHKSGVILFSGATVAIRGGSNFSAFTSAKFALRGFSQSLAREYQSSGIHGVDRIMLDRLGAETGRATSIVRYQPNSKFSEHIHTGGEEFLFLEGEFKDENGSYLVGTYVRNPIGTKHAPWADDAGATIFVKLHQFHETDKEQLQKTVFSETQILKTPDRYQNKPIHKHDNESVSIRFFYIIRNSLNVI